jgi:beta-N-acetylhexosaminidase
MNSQKRPSRFKSLITVLLVVTALLFCTATGVIISLRENPAKGPEESAAATPLTYTTPDDAGENPMSNAPTDTKDGIAPEQLTPEQTEADLTEAQIKEIIAEMSLHEKICQMFVVSLDSFTGVAKTNTAGKITQARLAAYPVGGISFGSDNMKNEEQLIKLVSGLQTFSKIPLLIAADEEGGRVKRLGKALAAHSIKAMYTYRDSGAETAFGNAVVLAQTLKKYGFNTDFAPVADVWTNKDNTVIGDRAYSDNFEQASELISAAVAGFSSENVISCLKHFPGHGDTKEDSHDGFAYVEKSVDELRAGELLPFAAGINAGADMVMPGHVTVKAVSSEPASLSYYVVTELLRNELHFSGVIITDNLRMGAITKSGSAGQIAVRAVLAGNDILLTPENLEEAIEAIKQAVQNGEITEAGINESVARILRMKIKHGLI